jgi:primosomal protein N' (replication factor Y)
MNILLVALDIPLHRLFDYRVEDARAEDIGLRVLVPFGRKLVLGIIVEVRQASDIDPAKLRDARAILRDTPALPQHWMDLTRFCAQYYQRPLGEVMLNALPPRLRKDAPMGKGPQTYALTDAGRDALLTLPARQKTKHLVLNKLLPGPAEQTLLANLAPSAARALAELRDAGWVSATSTPPLPPQFAAVSEHRLNPEQEGVVARIGEAAGRFGVFLLYGITGSGKTEVYMRLIASTLAAGKQALVLVPEINLTPQLEETFRRRFPGVELLTLHSGLAETTRAQHWLAAQAARPVIVLGTRLAVFTPLASPGLIVVDEEQDASYKQQDGVRYSARDLAIFRAQQADIPIVLGSATPSLESYSKAIAGRFQLLSLTRRAHGQASLPRVVLVDTNQHRDTDGLAAPLAEAIQARLDRGEQSLIFLNRRGYAPVLACAACGWVSGCPRCSARNVVHLADGVLRCHHCGDVERIPRACPECGNIDIQPFGRGTQRLETTLAARFAQARILRVDRDSTRNKGSWSNMRDSIRDGEADILIGTQILAKGHDFPKVTLVGVLNADAALHASDYRAGERLFAQLEQVAGRAGRAERPGEVFIQTRYAGHPLYQALVRHDYAGFAKATLAEREQAGFPPYVFEAVLRAEASSGKAVIEFLTRARELAPATQDQVMVFDPVPMSVARIADRERGQLLVQSYSRPALQTFLSAWSETLGGLRASGVRWHLDIDPIEF